MRNTTIILQQRCSRSSTSAGILSTPVTGGGEPRPQARAAVRHAWVEKQARHLRAYYTAAVRSPGREAWPWAPHSSSPQLHVV